MPPKGERRKQQIIDTAKDMFINKGFQSTHIGQVCQKLNIARGTVYQYFSNKKEILYAILDSVVESIEDIMDPDDLQEYLGANPDYNAILNFISNRMLKSINILLNEPIVIMLIFKDVIGIDDDVVNRVNRAVMTISKVIAKEIEELKARNIYKSSVNPRITATMVIGGVLLITYEYQKKSKDVLNKEVIESMAANYLYGVLK